MGSCKLKTSVTDPWIRDYIAVLEKNRHNRDAHLLGILNKIAA